MVRLFVLTALMLAAASLAQARGDEYCPAWLPEGDQLVALSFEPQAQGGFARALGANGRVVANRDEIGASSIFQLIGPVRGTGFALYSPAREAFVEIGEDEQFLFATANVEDATLVEFQENSDGSHFIKHISTARYVRLGDGKNGLQFSAVRPGQAQRFCIRKVQLED